MLGAVRLSTIALRHLCSLSRCTLESYHFIMARSHHLPRHWFLTSLRLFADTTTKYEETYNAGKAKCFTSGASAPEACAGPGGDPKDPKIYFGAPAPAEEKAAPKAEPEAK